MAVPGLIIHELGGDFRQAQLRIEGFFSVHGIIPMARIDHAQNASMADLSLSPMLLYIFGSPILGTPLMQECSSIGIDLPLKVLLWSEEGGVRMAFNEPVWLAQRHHVDHLIPAIEAMRGVLNQLTDAVQAEQ